MHWEMWLTNQVLLSCNPGTVADQDDNDFSVQARNAHEIMLLYHWWTEVRPNRKDVYDAVGLSAFNDEMEKKYRKDGDDDLGLAIDLHRRLSPADKAMSQSLHDQMYAMEKNRDKEDDEMLFRLIKIRRSLWC